MLLSIVIPVYNVENYVVECLDSILSQIDNDVEVLVINDGSTDNSVDKIEFLLSNATHCNIKFITKPNEGLSATRNLGLDIALGQYVWFFDSDDIASYSLYKTIKPLMKDGIDIIEFDAKRFTHSIYCKKNEYISATCQYSGYVSDIEDTFIKGQWFSWSRVFKRSLWDGLRFPVGRRFEDIATTPMVYIRAKTIFSIKTPLLFYRANPSSITSNLKPSDICDIEKSVNEWISTNTSTHHKSMLTISIVKICMYVNRMNYELNGNDPKFTLKIRKLALKHITARTIIKTRSGILYVIFPRLMNILSNLKGKL